MLLQVVVEVDRVGGEIKGGSEGSAVVVESREVEARRAERAHGGRNKASEGRKGVELDTHGGSIVGLMASLHDESVVLQCLLLHLLAHIFIYCIDGNTKQLNSLTNYCLSILTETASISDLR
jgi:hypothetical protein